jgi:hypothetical protein
MLEIGRVLGEWSFYRRSGDILKEEGDSCFRLFAETVVVGREKTTLLVNLLDLC